MCIKQMLEQCVWYESMIYHSPGLYHRIILSQSFSRDHLIVVQSAKGEQRRCSSLCAGINNMPCREKAQGSGAGTNFHFGHNFTAVAELLAHVSIN